MALEPLVALAPMSGSVAIALHHRNSDPARTRCWSTWRRWRRSRRRTRCPPSPHLTIYWKVLFDHLLVVFDNLFKPFSPYKVRQQEELSLKTEVDRLKHLQVSPPTRYVWNIYPLWHIYGIYIHYDIYMLYVSAMVCMVYIYIDR